LKDLSETKVNEVFDFIRFLKIQQETDKNINKRFSIALDRTRSLWKKETLQTKNSQRNQKSQKITVKVVLDTNVIVSGIIGKTVLKS